MPKAGTHLLTDCMLAMTGWENSRLQFIQGMPHQLAGFSSALAAMPMESVAYGIAYWSDGFAALLDAYDIRMATIIRDPRDIVVSWAQFAMMEKAFADPTIFHLRNHCFSDQDRYRAVLCGFTTAAGVQPDFGTFAKQFIPWLAWPGIVAVRYEDLVDPDRRGAALASLLDGLGLARDPEERQAAVARGAAVIEARSSYTFRRGFPGEWREEFDPLTRRLFETVAGDLPELLGYEPTFP